MRGWSIAALLWLSAQTAWAADWTVLFYFVGDTDLEEPMLNDLRELSEAQVGSAEVLVMADRAAGHDDSDLGNIPNWESTKLLRLGEQGWEELEDLGERNMGDPETLAWFLDWGLTQYPSERTMLLFSDHGTGWQGFGGDESTDDHDMLDLAELSQGIAKGLSGRGPLDLIGFDACLMATYEVAKNLAPFGDYLLASQALEPGHGWDYREFSVLAQQPDTPSFARAILRGFQQQAREQQEDHTITLSLLDLSQLSPLEQALEQVLQSLQDSESLVTIGRSQRRALEFGRDPNPAERSALIDLGHWARNLDTDGASTALRSASQALSVALDEMVIDTIDGENTRAATGVSVYFPDQRAQLDSAYQSVALIDPWRRILQGYLNAEAPSQTVQFSDPDNIATVEQDDDGGLFISGQLLSGAETVVEAILEYGVVDEDGSILMLGEEPVSLPDADGVVNGYWDQTVLVLDDGNNSAEAYLESQSSEQSGYWQLAVPLLYYPNGVRAQESQEPQELIWQVSIDLETQELVQDHFYAVDDTGALGSLTPRPGSQVVPELPLYDFETEEQVWLLSTDPGVGLDPLNLALSFEPLEEPVFLDLVVYGYADQSDSVSWSNYEP